MLADAAVRSAAQEGLPHGYHRTRRRPGGPGLPRQPHPRVRRPPRRRGLRPGDRPLRRLHRAVRGRRAARRRRPVRRQGRPQRRPQRQRGPGQGHPRRGPRPLRPAGRRPGAASTPTAPTTSPSSAPTPSSACRMAVARAAADSLGLPLYRYLGGLSAYVLPGADDERPQRRRARRQQRRLPGVHGRARRRRHRSPRGCAWGPRSTTPSRRCCKDRGLSTAVGDEGGFAPDLPGNEAALELLVEAVGKAGYEPGAEVALAMDPACTELYREGRYELAGDGRTLDSDGMIELWRTLADRYPIVSIEDGLAEDDWAGWVAITEALDDKLQLVGDDLFVTNVQRLQRGIDEGAANSILIKVNQIGTLTETFDAIDLAHRSNYTAVSQPPLGRDRGHHHRRHRGGHQLRPDQDRRARPAPTGWPSTTSCCGSRSSSATSPATRAARPSPGPTPRAGREPGAPPAAGPHTTGRGAPARPVRAGRDRGLPAAPVRLPAGPHRAAPGQAGGAGDRERPPRGRAQAPPGPGLRTAARQAGLPRGCPGRGGLGGTGTPPAGAAAAAAARRRPGSRPGTSAPGTD